MFGPGSKTVTSAITVPGFCSCFQFPIPTSCQCKPWEATDKGSKPDWLPHPRRLSGRAQSFAGRKPVDESSACPSVSHISYVQGKQWALEEVLCVPSPCPTHQLSEIISSWTWLLLIHCFSWYVSQPLKWWSGWFLLIGQYRFAWYSGLSAPCFQCSGVSRHSWA